ncbi:MAG: fibro-slime domain-containing protein, partial [Planctomycetota bacterium]
EQWRDDAHRAISQLLYDSFPMPGDVEGTWEEPGTGGISSARTFAHWFRDVPVYNMSMPLSLTLYRQADGMYVFDDQMNPEYIDLNGFYPIDGKLFADHAGKGAKDHNYYFTFEVHTQFQYDKAAGQNFKFEGTDTVWLYIDGVLVNDLIGVHAAHDQYVDVNRLGLEDGEWYQLDFFFAQRYMPQSHFRIETNILLESLHDDISLPARRSGPHGPGRLFVVLRDHLPGAGHGHFDRPGLERPVTPQAAQTSRLHPHGQVLRLRGFPHPA